MPKYYVESGTVRMVLAAEDSQRAALWFVHRILEGSMQGLYSTKESMDQEVFNEALIDSMLDLGHYISCNERGFMAKDRDEFDHLDAVTQEDFADAKNSPANEQADTWETFDLVMYWHQLMVAIHRMCE
jgi:hypothetical protein